MTESRSFEDLEIYKKAVEVRKIIWQTVKSWPKDEKYRLADQIIRSTRKCPANIAEGHGRYHYQENIQYNRIARGSLTETQDHLNVAEECSYITKERRDELKTKCITLIKMINGYIKYLSSKKKEKN